MASFTWARTTHTFFSLFSSVPCLLESCIYESYFFFWDILFWSNFSDNIFGLTSALAVLVAWFLTENYLAGYGFVLYCIVLYEYCSLPQRALPWDISPYWVLLCKMKSYELIRRSFDHFIKRNIVHVHWVWMESHLSDPHVEKKMKCPPLAFETWPIRTRNFSEMSKRTIILLCSI